MTVSLSPVYQRAALIVALIFVSGGTALSALVYSVAPAQEVETWAELKRSQRSGQPISDADIDLHLSRVRAMRRVYGMLFWPSMLSGIAIVVAMSRGSQN